MLHFFETSGTHFHVRAQDIVTVSEHEAGAEITLTDGTRRVIDTKWTDVLDLINGQTIEHTYRISTADLDAGLRSARRLRGLNYLG